MPRLFCVVAVGVCLLVAPFQAVAAKRNPEFRKSVKRALDYLAREQRRQGYWEANGGQYKVAMTALAANALACEGSTTTRGKYSENIRRAVDYLVDMSNPKTEIGRASCRERV